MALQYLFDPNKQFQSLGGVNEVSGFLRVYLNGTDDRATTYRNFDGGLNEPDIVLDTYGRAVVIVDDTRIYRLEVYNRLGGLMWTVSNYKARGGSGGGTGTPVSVEGTVGEIDVDESTEGGVKHFVVGLAATIKNAIATLTMAVNGVANALNGKKDRQTPVSVAGGTTKTLVGIAQYENGEISPEFDDIAFPDWTSAINAAVAACEKLENKKNTVTGYEASTTAYPTIKAVVDFVNGMLQNLGGKLITDNGNPFTSSAALPSSTPYGGVDIADKDYAYIQNVGTAERWSATVSGSSVVWVQEYAISIPVFTPMQQAAIDSGATSTKVGNYDAHLANTNNPHGVTAAQVGALTPTGNGSDVTATFTAAGSRVNISTGEKLSVIFGKIAKWFADLKAVAFSGSYTDLSDKPTIPAAANNGVLTIKQNGTSVGTFSANQSSNTEINVTDTTYESKPEASGGTAVSLVTTGDKYTWNHKQDALPTTGTPSSTFAINVSGTADAVRSYSLGVSDSTPWRKVLAVTGLGRWTSAAVVLRVFNWGYAETSDLATYYGTVVFRIYRGDDTDTFPTYRNLFVDNGMVADPSTLGWNARIVWTSNNDAELWLYCKFNASLVRYVVEYSKNCTIGEPIGNAISESDMTAYLNGKSYKNAEYSVAYNGTYPYMTVGTANTLKRAYINKSSQTAKAWKKIATSKTFTGYEANSICFLYNHSGYINEFGLDSIVSVAIHSGSGGSLVAARIDTYSYRSASETQIVRIGGTNQYEVWAKVPTYDTNMYATVLNSYGDWQINTDTSQTGQLTDAEFTAYKLSNPSIGTSYNYNIAKASKTGVGSTRLPIYANSDGTLSPINIDEYYCWAQPTTQWTDVMEMDVWYVQNQCNNEILGSTKRIDLTSSHPSLCYLNVRLPELAGAGRYRFTLEFEINNTDGQQSDNAYGVLILVPPTGYSGESFLAECAYDANGVPQSFLMNQFHVPRQGQTYRHKLYVDGHTYRVVKTK